MTTQPAAPASPPPFALPGEHFLAALVWLALVGTALPHVAPMLAAGNLFAPAVLAVTHALALGVLTTMIFGALYQFFPASLGVAARSLQMAHVTFWVLQAGVVAMVAGFWAWRPGLLLVGWVLLFLAVGGLAWNLLPQRRRATQGLLVGRYVSAGHMALGLAMILGLARIGEPLGWWTVSRTGFIAAHFHLAAIGFVTLTIVGVGSRMLPMFLFAQAAPTWAVPLIGPVTGLGLVVHATGLVLALPTTTLVGGFLLAAGGVLLLLQLALWFVHRSRKAIDPGVGYLLVAAGFLAATLAGGIGLLAADRFNPRAWAAYGVVALLGWTTLFTIGIAHRIVPFLSWLHLFGGMSRGAHAPPVTALTHTGLAWVALGGHATGVTALAAGILSGHAATSLAGGVLLLGATGCIVLQVLRGARLWWHTPCDPAPPKPSGMPLKVLS